MPTPLNRESLNKSLEERYKTQKVGGAFDAKKTQRIKQELSKLNYERYNFTDSSTSSKVTVFSEAKNAIIKKPKIIDHKYIQ